MAKAFKCDICDKLIENAYSVGGIDFYLDELADMGIKRDEARRKEVKEICESCHEAIRDVRNKLYRDSHRN